MKKEKNGSQKIYQKALVDLRGIIDKEYVDGGWLPSERMMCERLNVSRVTYRKIIHCLITENVVKTEPRRGHWVIEKNMRDRKVGIVIANGGDSPYLSLGNFLTQTLESLDELDLAAHLIQANRLDNIQMSVLSHAVEGLIWICPPIEALDVIRTIQADGIPVVTVSYILEWDPEDLNDINYVSMDSISDIGRAMRNMIERGYKRIVYLSSGEYDVKPVISSELQRAGIDFDSEQVIMDIENMKSKYYALADRGKIDVLFADGGVERLEALFRIIQEMPEAERPDLILPQARNVNKLYRKYKDIHITGFRVLRDMHLATTATEMLIRHLNGEEVVASKLVPSFDVVYND